MALVGLELNAWAPIALRVVLVVVIFYFGTPYVLARTRKRVLEFPMIHGPAGSMDLREAVKEGYAKHPDEPFQIQTKAKQLVLIPLKYLKEIKSLPESRLSSKQEIRNLFQGKYTGIGYNSHTMVNAVRVDLTQHIGKTLEALQDEMAFAASACIGSLKDWTPIPLYLTLLRIVALISGRIFVGLPLCRNDDWIRISINFTVVSFKASQKFWTIPAWKRPFAVPFCDETNAIKKHRAEAVELLAPVIQKRLDQMGDSAFKRPEDMIQWVLENAKDGGERSVERQADLQLTLSMAAIHTTSTTVLHCLYDLCTHPEYIQPLREEIEAVLAEGNGKFIKKSITKLWKLDSFIKESQRLSPPGLVAMRRLVMSDIHLSNGTVLPAGTSIAAPSWAVTRDDALFPDAETFDGFRFSKLRENSPGEENKHQFVMTGPDSLAFGYGTQACPGRFFASNEIKILLSYLLMEYEVRFEKEGEGRPGNRFFDLALMPDMGGKVLFKKRES
jgi:hypothetical protein